MTVPQIHINDQFRVVDIEVFKQKALLWSQNADQICFLDNNNSQQHSWDRSFLAIGAKRIINCQAADGAFEKLKAFREKNACSPDSKKKEWCFGFFSYDLKNDVEQLTSGNSDGIGMPELHFFVPEIVIEFSMNQVAIHCDKDPEQIFKTIQQIDLPGKMFTEKGITLFPKIEKTDYLKTIQAIRAHIVEGDLYEMNFCQEFFAENANINPYLTFIKLNKVARSPFAAFYKIKNKYLLCSSPERFLKKTENRLLAQPIKGTIRKGRTPAEKMRQRQRLYHSVKDRAENVMIVDLMRNDLARSCLSGTVKVDELFGVYDFTYVHHMISTISGTLRPDQHFMDAIKLAFPMGSMTGAPKVMSMKLIEHYEQTKRGLYSGAVGFINPDGDFDFNVVIRSLLYNKENKYLSCQVGGAIVYDSEPEQEYEECLLKVKGVRKVLGEL